MKTIVVSASTTSSSVKSSTTINTNMEDDQSGTPRDSCYFPGCRKDANCNCDICLASINATLDLMPKSIQRSSHTNRSASKPPVPRSPVSFSPSTTTSTPPGPPGIHRRAMVSPPLNSTARTSFHEKMKREKREMGFGSLLMRLIVGLSLILAAEHGCSWVVSEFLQPQLSPDMVRNVGEKSWVFQDLNQRLEFLKKELQGVVEGEVSSCRSIDSFWEINKDGLLLNSQCTLYKSAVEEVSIWGWPLQTAGLLTAEFSSRSFTILTGRITEWSEGKVRYSVRRGNSSWAQGRWSASVVQLNPNTWVLEYRRSSIMENSRLVSAALEFVKCRLSREFKKLKQEFWLLSAFGGSSSQYSDFSDDTIRIPT
ncbi:uncharacterized protein LOC132295357 [Cornus florida]|uniref:uncharacterized protein LOC132295357 n=1 Tax=Cornus florida TaxID=4283 RepID=UPI00289C6EC6|nr:uncharacterized protein LOC132295357 [Cornus florida]